MLFACESKKEKDCCEKENQTKCEKEMKAPYTKKYTNADFYKDGVFQPEVAKKAFYEMFEYYGYPVTDFVEKEAWYTDFGMGDFENCGMGGIFFVNDPEAGYFAHDIYLLPGQMIPEHSHVATKFPAKMETWMVRNGSCYNFTELGEPKADAEKIIPASQLATTKSKNYVVQNVGDIIHLGKIGSWHFLLAGENGAIVHEWANYHDGAGLRFTNPKAKL
ncbi:D-lyxose isomerase [Mucinivorans hirudinis]|uniref:D-lyxose isomerase n=1 Tax=Mucinivorans hirudinis TaxID=1433126 RepID=A0A060R5S8_9BACT|nr:D-lyxose isomerase [Mucinivorans hirudinis]